MTILTVGGIHLKAIGLLANGTEELQPRVLGRVVQASVSSLISAGLPYSVIEEAVINSSTSSLLRLLAYTSRARSPWACLEAVVLKALSFVMSVEKGYFERARTIAEEVTNARSLFIGFVMFSILERVPRGRAIRASGPEDISDQAIEKLITVLKRLNFSIGDILAKYSVAELLELYERLASVAEVDTLLSSTSRTVGNISLLDGGVSGAELDEDVLRQPFVTAKPGESGEGEPAGGSMREEEAAGVGEQKIAELVSRIEQERSILAVFDTVNKAGFREYLDSSLRQREATPTHVSMGRERPPDWWTVLALFAVAASVGSLYQLTVHRSSARLDYTKGVSRGGTRKATPEGLNPVIELFWGVVNRLTTLSKVEIRLSDTHREIVEKLCPYVDDVVSAGLRRLGKLYEAVRYAKTPPTDLLARDLRYLEKLLGA